jgi:thiol-disulfide isomerase/thioredoxin
MVLRALFWPVLVYTALAAAASPGAAQTLDAAARAEIAALRSGDMRKLVINDDAKVVSDAPIEGPDGAPTTLRASDGALRLVNFWATWCAPCREEMPAIEALRDDMADDGLEVILVATGRNSPEAIAAFFAQEGLSMETALDPGSTLARAMGVPGLPVTLIVSREGKEIARLLGGADWNSHSAKAIISDLLGR